MVTYLILEFGASPGEVYKFGLQGKQNTNLQLVIQCLLGSVELLRLGIIRKKWDYKLISPSFQTFHNL